MERMVYAFKAEKENLLESSSGGAFFALAEAFFTQKDGIKYVFGSSYDDNCNIITESACTLEECKKFRGSKYAECDYFASFAEVEEKLMAGYRVMYTGIPCQVHALLHYLKQKKLNTINLITVDIICHGMPQKRIWQDYKKKLECVYNGRLKSIDFRYKKSSSIEPVVAARFSDNRIIVETQLVRSYMTLYFTYLPLRKSCYQCRFSNLNRVSDITIGDFWGIENVMPEVPSKDGISEIIINSHKGQDLVENLKSIQGAVIKQCHSEDYIKYQHNLNSPTEKPDNVNEFWSDYEKNGFDYILTKYAQFTRRGKVLFNIKKLLRRYGIYTQIQQRIKEKV